MERPRHTEDIPYDIDKMALFVLKRSVVPESYEHARELTDEIIQDYLASFGDDIDEDIIDEVEDLIMYLREIETQADDEKESGASATELLDTLVIDLVTEESITSTEAQYLMLLFQLRPSDKKYDEAQRRSLAQQLVNLQAKIKAKLRSEPTVYKNKRRAYRDSDLQEGMEILETLWTILKLPSREVKPPFRVYIDERIGASNRQSDEQYYRDYVYEKVYYLLEKALSTTATDG